MPRRLRFTTAALLAAAAAAAAPAHAELVAFYGFEGNLHEAQGKTALNGTLFGTGTSYGTGYTGQGLTFNGGNNDAATVPINISPDMSPYVTIGAWVNVNDNNLATVVQSDGDWARKLSITNQAPAAGGLQHYGAFAGYTKDLTQGSRYRGTPTKLTNAPFDGWVFLAASYDNRAGKTVVVAGNSAETVNDSFLRQASSFSWLNIGALRNGGGSIFEEVNGTIDNVFVIKGAATQAQLESIRDAADPFTAAKSVGDAIEAAGPLRTWNLDFQVAPGGSFGSGSPVTATGIDGSETWNPLQIAQLPTLTTNASFSALKDSDGNVTTVGFQTLSNHKIAGYNVGGANSHAQAGQDGWLWKAQGADRNVDIKITGLNPDGRYRITPIGGWGGVANPILSLDVDGDGVRDYAVTYETTFGANLNPDPNSVPGFNFGYIKPALDGSIAGQLVGGSGNEKQIGGLIIEEIEVIPEPASLALVGLAGLLIAAPRRRRA